MLNSTHLTTRMRTVNKRERLRAIIHNTESLTELSKSHPQVFNEAVSDEELEKLKGLTLKLATNIEMRVNEGDDVLIDRFDLDPQTI